MKNFSFKDARELIKDFQIEKIAFLTPEKSVIFIFCANGIEELQKVGRFFRENTKTQVVGCTTAGNIFNSKLYEEGIVVSILEIEEGVISLAYADEKDDYLNGKIVASSFSKLLNENETALLILLTDGTYTEGEEVLRGIFEVSNNFSVVGGKAGNKNILSETAVLINDKVTTHGTVGVLLKEKDVKYKPDFLFDWKEIGREYLVTKSRKNRVFSINHLPAVEFYRKYLGNEVAKELPVTGIEYPLIFREKNIPIARACIKKHKDGSLSFSGNVPEGTKVRLGCGSLRDKDKYLSKFHELASSFHCFFIFSCTARKTFLGDIVKEELKVFNVPNCGFFTFGEYFSKYLLNETLTVVGLGDRKKEEKEIGEKKEEEKKKGILHSLTHLIAEISKEYDQLKDAINNSGFGLLILNEVKGKRVCVFASESLKEILGYDSEDFILGKVNYSIIHPADRNKIKMMRDKLINSKVASTRIDYRIILPNQEQRWIRSYVKVIEKGKEVILSFEDITDKKVSEERRFST
ncbi:MAG: FIST N-terminal domain-containing protein [Desulfurobacteriaceae bacterium]